MRDDDDDVCFILVGQRETSTHVLWLVERYGSVITLAISCVC